MTHRETRTRRSRAAAPALFALALLAIGCGGPSGPGYARVTSFELDPVQLCSGDAVTASWATVESIHNALVINGRYQPVADAGPYTEPAVTATTRFRLDATGGNGNMSSRVETAVTHRDGEQTAFAGFTMCSRELGVFTWGGEIPSQPHISGRLHVGVVRNTSGRLLWIRHNGHQASVGPMGSTPAFMGDPMNGPWFINGEVFGTEACESADGLPNGGPWLSFSAEIRC